MTSKYYNKRLKEFSRDLRSNGTKGEAILWKKLLRNKGTGFQFNRQFPVENYIVDFICRKLDLIIEIDGSSHMGEEQAIKDYVREQRLRELGFEVLRFKESEAVYRVDYVAGAIQDAVEILARKKGFWKDEGDGK